MSIEADDLAAGEYALGLLEGEALANFERRLARERELAARVARWREHFAALDATATPMRASPALWQRIEASAGQGGAAAAESRSREGLWSSLGFWRSASFASAAASLLLAVALGVVAGRSTPRPVIIAVMQTGE